MSNINLEYHIIIIGLGSMGKRRIRNLQSLGFKNIAGYDLRSDRRQEAVKLYNIKTIDTQEALAGFKADLMIISVPPNIHHIYMEMALQKDIHFFVEASVVDNKYEEIIEKLGKNKLIAAPSSTLYFHPAIKKIFQLVQSGALGTISNFIYHSGQYLPDWHTYEAVSDYYVSNKDTGGAREIVPFELTWITKLFGFPEKVASAVKKTIVIEGAEKIDDTYNIILGYNGFTVNLIVDVVSRYATRRLVINGDKKQLIWDWDENNIKLYNPITNAWEVETYSVELAAAGYNKNITEQMYVDELVNFFEAIEGKAEFFNSMQYDHDVLKLLYKIESVSI